MNDAQIARLEHKRERLLDELHHLPDLMRGKVYERERKCGRASCTCASGGPRHGGLQLTVNLGGRTRTRYVRQGERAVVEAKVAAYRRLWELVDELTEVNLALLNALPRAAQEKP
ncbi:MAG TPA: DUF6788 family protein [Candidatus Binatia bacterium]|jgi:hypothetical protein